MRGALLVATREIVERRSVLLAALVAGLLPFAAPLIPGIRSGEGAEARDAAALMIALAFGGGLSFLLGGTIVGRDLSERRLGFDFARPLSGGAIWAGRFLGAVGLPLLVAVVVVLPATVIGGGVLSLSFRGFIGDYSLACSSSFRSPTSSASCFVPAPGGFSWTSRGFSSSFSSARAQGRPSTMISLSGISFMPCCS